MLHVEYFRMLHIYMQSKYEIVKFQKIYGYALALKSDQKNLITIMNILVTKEIFSKYSYLLYII